MRRTIVWIGTAFLCLATLACGGAEHPTTSAPTAPATFTPTDRPVAQAEASSTQPPVIVSPTQTPTSEPVATESPTPTVEPFEALPIAHLDSLDGYRATMIWLPQDPEGTSYTFREEWARNAPARRQIMFDTLSGSESMPVFEAIMVQNSTWLRVGEAWIPLEQTEFNGIAAQWAGLERDAEIWMLEGSEIVNDIMCQRYRSVGPTSITLTDPQSGERVNAEIQGEIWLANEPGLPPVPVRERSQIQVGFFPILFPGGGTLPPTGSARLLLDYDLTELNGVIAIEPPE